MEREARIRTVLLGAGGHARVLIDALIGQASIEIVGLLEKDNRRCGESILGHRVLGDDSEEHLRQLREDGCRGFAIAFAGVGSFEVRRRLFQKMLRLQYEPVTICHPKAIYSTSSTIGAGGQLLANAVIGPGSELGCNVVVNTAAIVEHDCQIGTDCHIAPQACLAGGVIVEDGVHVGLGARVIENVKIGRGATVGAGAVVIRDVPEGVTVVGVPATTKEGNMACLRA